MSDSKPTINITRGRKESPPPSDPPPAAGPDVVSGLASGVRNVWLAGLGALSMAEELGTKTFDALVREGKSWESEQGMGSSAAGESSSAMKQLREGSAEAVASLERRIRSEVSDMVTQMGIPRRQDVDALREEVSELSEKVDRLTETLDPDPVLNDEPMD